MASLSGGERFTLPPCTRKARVVRLQVPTHKIGYVNAIVESHEEIGRVQTEDVGSGTLRVTVVEDWHDEFQRVVAQMQTQIDLRILSGDGNE